MKPDVSVVISTFNRCDVLRGALESLMEQDTGDASYEVIVVDNNSTDQTKSVVDYYRDCGRANIHYFFEEKQGVSHARNKGISVAQAQLIAFMDDDVRPAQNWVLSIKNAFDRFPEADCVGGKVLPVSMAGFPDWLTRDNWTPLAFLDMGDEPMWLDVIHGPGVIGANMAVRAAVFTELSDFSPELQRVKDTIGSMEDHEFLLRLSNAGKRLLYAPDIVVKAHVFPERLTKSYHRRWHHGHGHFYALMRAQDFESSRARIFDVPAHLYRQALSHLFLCLKYRIKNRPDQEFRHEAELNFFLGFFRKRFSDRKAL